MIYFNRNNLSLYIIFTVFLILNIALWAHTHRLRQIWSNVPPPLTEEASKMINMGDTQLAYRRNGLMLQNLGSDGGASTALKDYNYQLLGGWFFLQNALDPIAQFTPYLAAYYFGSTQNPKEQVGPLLDYLEAQGQSTEKQKWRWLAHAVYLARYRKQDMPRALELANKLANLPVPDLPIWAKAMPALVARADGDKEAAYTIMMGMLASSAKTLSPFEIRFLRDNICNRTLTPEQAAKNQLCQTVK